MTGPLATILIVAPLLLAVAAAVLLVVNRPPGRPMWLAIGVLEAVTAAFVGWGLVEAFTREVDFPRLEFVLYLLGLLVVVPAAAWWVREEKSRAAAGVLLVAFLVAPFMVLRVQQVWEMTGG